MDSNSPPAGDSPKTSKSPRGGFKFPGLSSRDRREAKNKKGKSPEKPIGGSDRVKKSSPGGKEMHSGGPVEEYFERFPTVHETDEENDPKQVPLPGVTDMSNG